MSDSVPFEPGRKEYTAAGILEKPDEASIDRGSGLSLQPGIPEKIRKLCVQLAGKTNSFAQPVLGRP